MDVAELHERLAQRAFLHDDPDAYLAGVSDALEILVEQGPAAWEPDDTRGLRGA